MTRMLAPDEAEQEGETRYKDIVVTQKLCRNTGRNARVDCLEHLAIEDLECQDNADVFSHQTVELLQSKSQD